MDRNMGVAKVLDRTNPLGLAYIGLFVTMLFWGMVPAFLKMLLVVFTPTELSFTRFLLSGLILLAWVAVKQPRALGRIVRRDPSLLLLCTIFGPLSAMVCFNFAIVHITIGTAAVFAAIEPLCTYLLAVLCGQEAWRTRRLLSILVALLGIAMVILARQVWGVTYWISLLLVTLTPMIWAVNNILTKELVKRHSPLVMIATSFVLSALFLIPTLSPAYLTKFNHMNPNQWFALAYCVLCTIFGFMIWYWSLKYLPPSSVAMSMYVIPIFSVLSGVVLLGEPISWLKGAGIATVLLGLYLVNVRFR